MRERNSQAGLTLIELMIGMVIAGIALGAALSVGVVMGGQFREHRDMAQTERAARIALELVADGLRGASPGVPSGLIYDAVGCSEIQGVRVTNASTGSYASSTYGTLSPADGTDVLEMVEPSGGVVSTVSSAFLGTATFVPVVDDANWQQGDYVLVTDFSQGHVMRVSDAPSGNRLPVVPPDTSCAAQPVSASGYAAGSLAIRVRIVRYFVADLGGAPYFMIDLDADGTEFEPEPIAGGVEDFQVAVGIDVDGDGALMDTASDTDEWFYNVSGDDAATVIASPSAPAPPTWRAVRISIVARTFDPMTTQASFPPVAVEDHDPGTTLDAYRRRTLSTTVELRNLDGSP
jgi:prepilin-type N-terminal cleavage/methylation domain-containing protein